MNNHLADSLLERALEAARRQPPASTYRLQFHSGFTFRDAREITSYLSDLGITHCYASPYLKARPGSEHGYDITDHGALNPELGTEADYREWMDELHRHGMGQILDIVPNHMAVATNDNTWWNDVLENGPASRYSGYFDISWHASHRQELRDKVLLPFLRSPYGQALEAGEIRLIFGDGAFAFRYFDRQFPVAPDTYDMILAHRLEDLEGALGSEDHAFLEYQSILTAVRNLPGRLESDPAKISERSREKEIIKRRLANLPGAAPEIHRFLVEILTTFNGRPGRAATFDLMDRLLERQCFRLSYWRVATDEINYRRFFDINDLAALNAEREDVSAAACALVLQLVIDKSVDGLRVDHPDGLYDPAHYFRGLQERFLLASGRRLVESAPEFSELRWEEAEPALRAHIASSPAAIQRPWPLYVVAEKILGPNETLPRDWSVAGTTGYEFLNTVNGLFVDPANERAFSQLYHDVIHDDTGFAETVYRKKRLVLDVLLASELHMLTRQLDRLAQKSRQSRDFTFNTLRQALREIIASFPVYRSYIADGTVHDEDRRHIDAAVRWAVARNPLLGPQVFKFIQRILLLEDARGFDDEDRAEQRRFAGKFQQVTAPVTAKGIEDTAFYVYNRLVSLNEVGGNPNKFGISPDAVHTFNQERQQKWPLGLSPLSTHDTKRSEDVRARLNVLSEIPDEWRTCVVRWMAMNAAHRETIDNAAVPDANEEYLFYETLVGSWPLEGQTNGLDSSGSASYVGRIQSYMEKALHEAKVHTSWINPNAEYDRAVSTFVHRVLDGAGSRVFLDDFRAFQNRIAGFGLFNSLSQTLLRIASPGVPDTYRGAELWDFSLVDPDNRRPVDYVLRRSILRELQDVVSRGSDLKPLVRQLLQSREDGRVKMYVTFQALHCRRSNPRLFSEGEYLPLRTSGDRADHLFGFARLLGDRYALIAVPRFFTRLMKNADESPGADVWGTTVLGLEGLPGDIRWVNVFTGAQVSEEQLDGAAALTAAKVFADFPVALLIGKRATTEGEEGT